MTIESIGLWIRIYDIPVDMMTEGFIRALGGKLGRVIQVGEAVQDYKKSEDRLLIGKADHAYRAIEGERACDDGVCYSL